MSDTHFGLLVAQRSTGVLMLWNEVPTGSGIITCSQDGIMLVYNIGVNVARLMRAADLLTTFIESKDAPFPMLTLPKNWIFV